MHHAAALAVAFGMPFLPEPLIEFLASFAGADGTGFSAVLGPGLPWLSVGADGVTAVAYFPLLAAIGRREG
jgi:hypothetical protein